MSWGMVGAAAIGAVASTVQSNKASNASKDAAKIQANEARAQAENVREQGERALGFFQPFQQLGERGLQLSDYLANPDLQAQSAFNNPLFQMSRDAMARDINKSSAARGRLSSGDTLMQLQNASAVAAQPFIDRNRQDILNLLNLGGSVAGNQANTVMDTQGLITDLLTGAASATASGVVGSANADNANIQNIGEIGQGLVGSDFSGGRSGSGTYSDGSLI